VRWTEGADDFSEVFASRIVGFLIESRVESPFCHEKEASADLTKGLWVGFAFWKKG
jgi:hypothetical protein